MTSDEIGRTREYCDLRFAEIDRAVDRLTRRIDRMEANSALFDSWKSEWARKSLDGWREKEVQLHGVERRTVAAMKPVVSSLEPGA